MLLGSGSCGLKLPKIVQFWKINLPPLQPEQPNEFTPYIVEPQ